MLFNYFSYSYPEEDILILAVGVILNKSNIINNRYSGNVSESKFKPEDKDKYYSVMTNVVNNKLGDLYNIARRSYGLGGDFIAEGLSDTLDLDIAYQKTIGVLRDIFSNKDFLSKYPVVKKEIMQDIINNDLDILEISVESIIDRFLYLPETRRVLFNYLIDLFKESKHNVEYVMNKEDKRQLAVLCYLAFDENNVDPSAFEFVKRIANIFEIEEEYLEEFIEPVKSIHLARLELNELINE